MLAAGGERDIEGDGFRIGEEEFVEIAHAEEEQRIQVVGLEGEPLCHGRRCARRVGSLQGVPGCGRVGRQPCRGFTRWDHGRARGEGAPAAWRGCATERAGDLEGNGFEEMKPSRA